MKERNTERRKKEQYIFNETLTHAKKKRERGRETDRQRQRQ